MLNLLPLNNYGLMDNEKTHKNALSLSCQLKKYSHDFIIP